MPTYQAVLSKTTADLHKSKILSPQVIQLVLDVYMTPTEFAQIVEKYDESEFKVEIKK